MRLYKCLPEKGSRSPSERQLLKPKRLTGTEHRLNLLGRLSRQRSQSAAVGTIVMCDVFPDLIRSRTVRTSTIRQSIQSLRSGAQMGIAGEEQLIRRLHPGCGSVSSSSSLSLPLLDRLTDILPPLIQELCMPIGRGCLLFGTHLSLGSTSAVGGCCRFSRGSTNASLQVPPHRFTYRTETRQVLSDRQTDRQPKMDGVERHYIQY
jgi:hypothetical protein